MQQPRIYLIFIFDSNLNTCISIQFNVYPECVYFISQNHCVFMNTKEAYLCWKKFIL